MKLLHLSLMCTLTVQPLKFHLTVHEHGVLPPASKTVTFPEDSSPVGPGLEVLESPTGSITAGGWTHCHALDCFLCGYTTGRLSAAAWADSRVSEREL